MCLGNIYLGRLFISHDDEITEVSMYTPNTKLKKERGYLKGDYVYIYHGRLKRGSSKMGIYKNDDDSYTFIEPSTSEKKVFAKENIIEFDINKIFNEIKSNKDDFISEEEVEIMNANMEKFIPVIKHHDDFLKRAIKEAFILKQVNLKIYKDKFKNEHSLNNMKSALGKESKMSVSYFLDWCDVLGLKWSMTIEDDGTDKISPLTERIIVSSDD